MCEDNPCLTMSHFNIKVAQIFSSELLGFDRKGGVSQMQFEKTHLKVGLFF